MIRQIRLLTGLLMVVMLVMSRPVSASGTPAPEWDVSEWINGQGVSVAELQGKVVVVEFFQLWCPGCNNFSIPLMKQWQEHYAEQISSGDLVLVSIHTVFEGHDYQNPQKLRQFLKRKGITHLIGVDRHHQGEEIPETMKRFGTRGTPEMAFIDRSGNIRFQRFGGFEPVKAEELIDTMLGEDAG